MTDLASERRFERDGLDREPAHTTKTSAPGAPSRASLPGAPLDLTTCRL
jgi:hypothetical protein